MLLSIAGGQFGGYAQGKQYASHFHHAAPPF
jgi:hypothetical protein